MSLRELALLIVIVGLVVITFVFDYLEGRTTTDRASNNYRRAMIVTLLSSCGLSLTAGIIYLHNDPKKLANPLVWVGAIFIIIIGYVVLKPESD